MLPLGFCSAVSRLNGRGAVRSLFGGVSCPRRAGADQRRLGRARLCAGIAPLEVP